MFDILFSGNKINGILIFSSFILSTGCSATVNVETANNTNAEIQTREQWRELLKWPKSCDDGVSHITRNSDDFIGVETYDWIAGKKLITVTCETGAYNQGEMLFLETGKRTNNFDLIVFPQFRLIKDAPEGLQFNNKKEELYYQYSHSLLWGNIRIDNARGNINNNNFYRGGGGCGVSTTYLLLDLAPKIVSLNTNESCEGNVAISEWKVLPESEYSEWPVFK